jgi:hypothetical protein
MIRTLLRALPAAALLWCGAPAQAQDSAALAAVNKLTDGGFESGRPSYWTPSGAGATWSTAQFHSGTHSVALSGAGEASWTQGEVVRNWVSNFPANAALTLKVWVRAEGVNTNPTTDAGKYQMVATFRDANGADILGQPVVLDMPQGAASTGGWVQVTTAGLGDITLPVPATSVTVSVRKGATATGTMYFDDFAVSGGGGWHGANVDLPGDWYTYWPDFDGSIATPRWAVAKTTAQAHTGSASLRVERLGTAAAVGGEAVAISQRVPVTVGRPVLVSYWVKTEGNALPDSIGRGDNNIGLTALWYSNLQSGAAGYNELGGADIRLNGEFNPQVIPLLPRQAANGWTQYSFVVNPIANAVAIELRLRYWHAFTGVTYWDDVFIGDVADVVAQVPNLLPAAAQGFEGTTPSYWTPSGAGATWSTARAHSGTHSLALSGAGAASWTQSEVVRNWVDRFPANAALTLKAWVWTEGVNTNPTTDAGKYQIVYTFRDANGANILGQDVVLDLPQTAATTGGWVQVTTAGLGDITLPVDARSVTAVVRKGASATGTVYVDDFAVSGGGGWHGANVDLPGDWYTYWPDFDGSIATPQWVVAKTTAQAHTGSASLRVERLGTAAAVGGEAVAITPRVPAAQGQPMLVSYWVKHDNNADPTTIGSGDNNIGMTALWYSNILSGAAGYNEIGGADIRLNGEFNPQVIPLLPRQASNGWTNYAFVLNPIANSAAMEVRLRYWHAFTGVTYWDDIALTNIAGANLFNPVAGEEAPVPSGTTSERWMTANVPNPFSGATEVRFTLPQAEEVSLEVYDLLGRRVALLLDGEAMSASEHAVAFEGGGLPSGTYLLVLRTPSHSEARQVTVVR